MKVSRNNHPIIVDTYSYKYTYLNCEYPEIHPLIELKRLSLLKKIRIHFFNVVSSTLDKKLFEEKKKSPFRIICSIFSRWYFSQHMHGKCTKDPVIPQDPDQYQTIIDDINYMYGKINTNKELIKKLLYRLDLKNKCNDALQQLNKFIKQKKYNKPYKIQRKLKNQVFLRLLTKEKSYKSIPIAKQVYLKLKIAYDRAEEQKYSIDTLVWCFANRYLALNIYNLQLAIPPGLYNKLYETLGINFELFASSINNTYHQYCSLFYDIEKYFGSRGSFFSIKLTSGFYAFNPPFDELIMSSAVSRILAYLKNSKEGLGFFITIPVWDKESMMKLKKKHKDLYIPKYVPKFTAMELLKKSGMIKFHKIYYKNEFPYFDYVTSKFKRVANTHVIIIANKHMKVDLSIFKKIFK